MTNGNPVGVKLLPAHTIAPDTVHCMDALRLLNALPSASVDMILADLPYQVLETKWDRLIPVDMLWTEFHRVIKPCGAIVLTAKQPFASLLITSNLSKYRYSWYWEKTRGANVAQTSYRPLAVVEEILVFSHAPAVYSAVPTINYYPQKTKLEKPQRRAYKPEHRSVSGDRTSSPIRNPERGIGTRLYEYATPRNLIYVSDDGERGLHPTQKPVALFEYLIRTYTQPGDLVFDPCVGSGTTAVAARNTGRRFIVGDSSAEYVEVTKRRLAAPRTLPMFAEAG